MISLHRRSEPSGVTIGKSLGETTVWIRNSGGAPTMMWTSDALAATAFRRMSFNKLIVCPWSVVRCQSLVLAVHIRVTKPYGGPRTTDRVSPLPRVLGHAEDLVDRRQAALHLVEPVLPQRHQPALAAQLAEVGDVGVARHRVAQPVVHHQHLVDAQAARVARLAATVTPLAPKALFGPIALHREELFHLVGRLVLLLALLADFPDQPLGQDRVQRGADQVRLDADVDQSRDRRRRVVGVQ